MVRESKAWIKNLQKEKSNEDLKGKPLMSEASKESVDKFIEKYSQTDDFKKEKTSMYYQIKRTNYLKKGKRYFTTNGRLINSPKLDLTNYLKNKAESEAK